MNRVLKKKVNIKRKENVNKKLLVQIIFSILLVVAVVLTKQFGNEYMEKYFNVAKEKMVETVDYKNVFTNIKNNLTSISNNLTAKILNREYAAPVNGTIISSYGLDDNSEQNVYNHGIDIASTTMSVKSISNGQVTSVGKNNKMNYYAIVKHEDVKIIYSMLDEVFLKKGDSITAGQLVGRLNDETKVLHLEVWQNGESVNPAKLFKLHE